MKINPIYTKKETLHEMINFFEIEGFIQLSDFIIDDLKKIKEQLLKEKYIKEYIPDQKNQSILNKKEIFNLEIIKFIEFFKSKEFLSYIEDITELDLVFKKIDIKKYEKKDFTLLNDRVIREDNLEVYFDLTSNWKEDMGGYLTFTSSEEEFFYLHPLYNALTIIYKPSEILKFLKYINNKAENNSILRVEIIFEIQDL